MFYVLSGYQFTKMNNHPLEFMYITNNPVVAKSADELGVKRVWIDLETLGKEERQKGMNTVKSQHALSDISAIKPVLYNSELLVRVNPINSGSAKEIDEAISRGADMLMLPMFKTASEVEAFLNLTKKRNVKTTLLFETKEAIRLLPELLKKGGFDEMHIGLNDLHLSLGLTFMFELLPNGIVEDICHTVSKYHIPYGFGGIAKIGEGLLPAEKIIAEHFRLGSTRAILSRSFCDNKFENYESWRQEFKTGIEQIRSYESWLSDKTERFFAENKKDVATCVQKVVQLIKAKQNNNG